MADLPFRIVVRDDGTAVIQGFGRSLDRVRRSAAASGGILRKTFAGVGRSLFRLPGLVLNLRTALVGLLAGLAIRKIADVFGTFQRELLRVSVLTSATKEQMAQLTAQAEELGRTTQFSAREAAGAMSFLAKAGFEANEVFKALPRTLELAAAAQIDVGKAADIVTNILTGLGVPLDELARANDVLVETFTQTNTDLIQLGNAFKFVGPITQAAGVEFEEVAAALGLLGNAGIQATLAGTALRGIVARLIAPSREAAKVIKQLGLDAFIVDGRVKSLAAVIERLEEAAATPAQLLRIFGQRAGPGMAALVNQGSQALRDLTEDLRNSGGRAQEVAEVQLRGLTGAIIKMKSAIESTVISLGKDFEPLLVSLAQDIKQFAIGMADAFRAMREGRGDTEDLIKSVSTFKTVLADILPSAQGVIRAMFFISSSFIRIENAVLGLKVVFNTLAQGIIFLFARPVNRVLQAFMATVAFLATGIIKATKLVITTVLNVTGAALVALGKRLNKLGGEFAALGADALSFGIDAKFLARTVDGLADGSFTLNKILRDGNKIAKKLADTEKDFAKDRIKNIELIKDNKDALKDLNLERDRSLKALQSLQDSREVSLLLDNLAIAAKSKLAAVENFFFGEITQTNQSLRITQIVAQAAARGLGNFALSLTDTFEEQQRLNRAIRRFTKQRMPEMRSAAKVAAAVFSPGGGFAAGLRVLQAEILNTDKKVASFQMQLIKLGTAETLQPMMSNEQAAGRIIAIWRTLPDSMRRAFAEALVESKGNTQAMIELATETETKLADLRRQRLRDIAGATSVAANLFGNLADAAETSGKRGFETAKKLRIAEALISGLAGSIRAFADLPFPVAVAASAAILAGTFATIQRIRSPRPGGGGGGGGGVNAGGGGGAVGVGPEESTARRGEGISITISIAEGFVGSPQELASALAPVIREAVGDGADFGLEISNG